MLYTFPVLILFTSVGVVEKEYDSAWLSLTVAVYSDHL
jgi:hypothetical protein